MESLSKVNSLIESSEYVSVLISSLGESLSMMTLYEQVFPALSVSKISYNPDSAS